MLNNEDFELIIKKQHRIYVVNKLSRYFNVDKQDLLKNVNIDQDDILYFDCLNKCDFHYIMYTAHLDKLRLEDLLYGERFEKSDIYAAFVENEQRVKDHLLDDFLMIMHVNKLIWVIRRNELFEHSMGGINVITKKSKEVFMIEPIDNFLVHNYPIEEHSD